MLTFLQFLSERRSNPDLNNDRRSLVDKILEYKDHPDRENIGISFTSVPKFGINPQSDFNTPIGIYAYPINYVISLINPVKKVFSVPFAGDRSYYFIFKVNTPSKLLNIQKATKNDFNIVLKILENYNKNNPSNIFDINTALIKVKRFFGSKKSKLYGALIFGLTRFFSMHLNEKLNQPLTRTWGFALDKIFGYTGVIDNGDGVIHSEEPTQMFIMKKEYGTLLDLWNNDSSNRDIDAPQSHHNLFKFNQTNNLHSSLLNDLSSLQVLDKHNKEIDLSLNSPISYWIVIQNKSTPIYSLDEIISHKFFIDLFAKINGNYDLIYNNKKARYLLSLAFYFPAAISQRDKQKFISYYREKTNNNIIETLYSVSNSTDILPKTFIEVIESWKLYLSEKDLNAVKNIKIKNLFRNSSGLFLKKS